MTQQEVRRLFSSENIPFSNLFQKLISYISELYNYNSEAITLKADLIDGKIPLSQLPITNFGLIFKNDSSSDNLAIIQKYNIGSRLGYSIECVIHHGNKHYQGTLCVVSSELARFVVFDDGDNISVFDMNLNTGNIADPKQYVFDSILSYDEYLKRSSKKLTKEEFYNKLTSLVDNVQ